MTRTYHKSKGRLVSLDYAWHHCGRVLADAERRRRERRLADEMDYLAVPPDEVRTVEARGRGGSIAKMGER